MIQSPPRMTKGPAFIRDPYNALLEYVRATRLVSSLTLRVTEVPGGLGVKGEVDSAPSGGGSTVYPFEGSVDSEGVVTVGYGTISNWLPKIGTKAIIDTPTPTLNAAPAGAANSIVWKGVYAQVETAYNRKVRAVRIIDSLANPPDRAPQPTAEDDSENTDATPETDTGLAHIRLFDVLTTKNAEDEVSYNIAQGVKSILGYELQCNGVHYFWTLAPNAVNIPRTVTINPLSADDPESPESSRPPMPRWSGEVILFGGDGYIATTFSRTGWKKIT